MLYAVDQQASSSEMQQWFLFMLTAVDLLPPTHGVSGPRAHLCKVLPCSWRRARQLSLSVLTSKPMIGKEVAIGSELGLVGINRYWHCG